MSSNRKKRKCGRVLIIRLGRGKLGFGGSEGTEKGLFPWQKMAQAGRGIDRRSGPHASAERTNSIVPLPGNGGGEKETEKFNRKGREIKE